jgi:hypothetical protein
MKNPFYKYNLTGETVLKAINRHGEEFEVGEAVLMKEFPVLYEKMIGHELEIIEIFTSETCDSGYMVHVIHKETKNKFRSLLDVNWFKKINTQ